MSGCQLVFVDPDNGLPVSSVGPYGKRGPKYVFFDELSAYLQDDRTVVVYQHLPREEPRSYVSRRADQLRDNLPGTKKIWALIWRPYSVRAYFILPNGREDRLKPVIEEFLDGPWGRHFEAPLFP